MSTLQRRFMRLGNRFAVWIYRTLDGRLSSGSKDVHVLMLTTPGRRTGIPRSTCVRYLETPEGYVVRGTGSGSRRDPDWFRNLRAAPAPTSRSGTVTSPRVPEAPEVRRYAEKAGRTIPVAVLVPET